MHAEKLNVGQSSHLTRNEFAYVAEPSISASRPEAMALSLSLIDCFMTKYLWYSTALVLFMVFCYGITVLVLFDVPFVNLICHTAFLKIFFRHHSRAVPQLRHTAIYSRRPISRGKRHAKALTLTGVSLPHPT